jgi:hypothetical protein
MEKVWASPAWASNIARNNVSSGGSRHGEPFAGPLVRETFESIQFIFTGFG